MFQVRRVLDIWGERQVFPDKFLKELVAILESGKKKDIHDIVDSFQPNQLCTQIKIMKALEDDTEYKLKTLSKSGINKIFDLGNIPINDVRLFGVIFYPPTKVQFLPSNFLCFGNNSDLQPTLKSNIIYARSLTLRFKYLPDSIL